MKIKNVIIYIVIITNAVLAYTTNKIQLAETGFEPIPKGFENPVYMGDIVNYTNRVFDIQVATLTISFDMGAIGQDFDGVKELVRKEAAKAGANRFYYISGTEYSKTKEIASATFRLVRTKDLDVQIKDFKINNANSNVYNMLYSQTGFYGLFLKTLDSLNTQFSLSKLNIKRKRDNTNNLVYHLNGNILSKKEVDSLVQNFQCNYIINTYRDNITLYKQDYSVIQNVLAQNPNTTIYFPQIVNDSLLVDSVYINWLVLSKRTKVFYGK